MSSNISDDWFEAWNIYGRPSDLPVAADDLVYARRLVAQRCLYGVDKNPMAIDLARLSLWLATLAKDHEFTFIDHALRNGDSLVGLSRRQIEGFHWKADSRTFQMGTETVQVRQHVTRASNLRKQIRDVGDGATELELIPLLEETQDELRDVHWFGALVLDAFFGEERPADRSRKRSAYADLVVGDEPASFPSHFEDLELSIKPFHWEVEFPEVFDRENPGFDAIVGNPPFAGKNTIMGILTNFRLPRLAQADSS